MCEGQFWAQEQKQIPMQIPPALAPHRSLRPPSPCRVIKDFWGPGVVGPAALCRRPSPRRVAPSLAPAGLWSRPAARKLRRSGNLSHPIRFRDRSAVRLELLGGPTRSDWRGGGGSGGEQRRRERGAKSGKEGPGEPPPAPPLSAPPFSSGLLTPNLASLLQARLLRQTPPHPRLHPCPRPTARALPSGCGQQVAPLAAQRLPPVLGLRKERRLTRAVRFGSGTLWWRGEWAWSELEAERLAAGGSSVSSQPASQSSQTASVQPVCRSVQSVCQSHRPDCQPVQ